VPRDGRERHPALIYVKGKEDVVYGVDYDNLLSAYTHHVVLVLQPRAVDYPMDNFRTAATKMSVALLGGTLETLQLWDMLQAMNYLVDEEKLKLDSISMYGRKQMGGLALHAAAGSPKDVVFAAEIETPGEGSLGQSRLHRSFDELERAFERQEVDDTVAQVAKTLRLISEQFSFYLRWLPGSEISCLDLKSPSVCQQFVIREAWSAPSNDRCIHATVGS